MASTVYRRSCLLFPKFTSHFRLSSHCFSSRFSISESGKNTVSENEPCSTFGEECRRGSRLNAYAIETMDDETWNVSSSLSQSWRQFKTDTKKNSTFTIPREETILNDGDDDEIDNMRIRGDLFYKLDRGSKEFEEYNYDFHRKNHHKQNQELTKMKKTETQKTTKKQVREEYKKKEEEPKINTFTGEIDNQIESVKKRERTLTFNQITAPYHYPFCLDIYISKASVRACVIHRVTSKVVSVAHSISKDLKFDLGSTRNVAACVAVGTVLAQRSLEDDIHDVVYTPRKGDKVEGKLQVVLEAIIENGVNVTVKLKQRKKNTRTGGSSLCKSEI